MFIHINRPIHNRSSLNQLKTAAVIIYDLHYSYLEVEKNCHVRLILTKTATNYWKNVLDMLKVEYKYTLQDLYETQRPKSWKSFALNVNPFNVLICLPQKGRILNLNFPKSRLK